MKVEVYRRDAGGHWWLETLVREDELRLESVGLSIAMSEVYEDVRL
jgi:Uma2 family endonuclease